MKALTTSVLALFLSLATACLVHASTVTKRDGQVVEGRIQGLIALKARVEKLKQGSEIAYRCGYTLYKGDDITAIDELGVHMAQGASFKYVGLRRIGKPCDDSAVLHALTTGGQFVGYEFPMRADARSERPVVLQDTVLGEMQNQNGKGSLVPAL